ncbi:MAG: DNA polymerase/3'-5' exonuclease PolX [Deltaproteobacteria bacterium]|nr:DNA polymerase/3'-5' exonuclease PolX [Deltaproteobacteria bacterium]
MPVHNSDIAALFSKVADLLEIDGANAFRIRAYRNAARTIEDFSRSLADMIANNEEVTKIPGIGKDLADKIKKIVQTGTFPQLKEIESHIPPELRDMMKIAALGPKRVHILYEKLKVSNIEQLEKAAKGGKVRELAGFGQKTEEKIIEEIHRKKQAPELTKLITAERIAQPLIQYLKKIKGVDKVIAAGSLRRRKEVVGDLDILATCAAGSKIMQGFVNYEEVKEIISQGETRSTIILRTGFQVDLRVVPQNSYGAALHYFTGSKAHNIAIRKLGQKKNLKINEYGMFRDDTRIGGKTEEEIFSSLDLAYIEPELREDRGEIEAAKKNQLPHLVTLEDIRGDLHAHTTATDGHLSLEETAHAAAQKGYQYIAITDHSKRVTMVHGLNAERLLQQIEEIDRLNRKLQGAALLKGIELDILEDGTLDLPDDVLKHLDLTVCSIHYKFNLSREKQTERILRAMDNPYFTILGHPTGRLINERRPYEVDLERIIKAAKERGCFIEINAHPDRLDLTDIYCKMAKDMGVKIAISTDAHSLKHFDYLRFGIGQARRGWLGPEDVLNTRNLEDLKKLLQRK